VLRGLDVSSAQGIVDWASVKAAGYSFAYAKCATGNETRPDPQAAANLRGAKAAGLYVGCYNFAFPLPPAVGRVARDPVAQAELHYGFARDAGFTEPGCLPPVLDLEWPEPPDWPQWLCTKSQIAQWGLDYLARARDLWGVELVFYSYPYFWKELAPVATDYARSPLWWADYVGSVEPKVGGPSVPVPWSSWAFWQWSGGRQGQTVTHTLPNGVPVDGDLFNGDETALQTLLLPTPIAPGVPMGVVEVGQPTPPGDLDEG
jgi:GH25 family lysozyme M1 (1,4-beta-N-acetylmuramidase)